MSTFDRIRIAYEAGMYLMYAVLAVFGIGGVIA